MKNKNRILTESEKKDIIKNKEKAILESFASTFNKIKRIDENEVVQKPIVIDWLGVSRDGSFEGGLFINGIDVDIAGDLVGFDYNIEPYEPQTYHNPASGGGVYEVLFDDVTYDYLKVNNENELEITNPQEIIIALNSMGENFAFVLKNEIEGEIDDMMRDGYFDEGEFEVEDDRDDDPRNEYDPSDDFDRY